MTLLDWLLQVSGGAWGGAFLAVPLLAILGVLSAIPLLQIYHWWAEGEIFTGTALWMAVGYLMLMFFFFGPSPLALKPLILVFLVVLGVGFLLFNQFEQSRIAQQIEQEREARAREMIERDPENASAYVALAESLWRQHRYEEAINTLRSAIQISPKTTQEETRLLRRWEDEFQGMIQDIAICPECRQESPRRLKVCRFCGCPFSFGGHLLWGLRLVGPEALREALIAFLPISLLIFLAGFFPSFGKTLANLSMLALLGWFLWLIFRKK